MKHVTLREARRRRRLTQMELSAVSGVSQSVITKLEKGRVTNPNFSTVMKLARALHVDPAHLKFAEEVVA